MADNDNETIVIGVPGYNFLTFQPDVLSQMCRHIAATIAEAMGSPKSVQEQADQFAGQLGTQLFTLIRETVTANGPPAVADASLTAQPAQQPPPPQPQQQAQPGQQQQPANSPQVRNLNTDGNATCPLCKAQGPAVGRGSVCGQMVFDPELGGYTMDAAGEVIRCAGVMA